MSWLRNDDPFDTLWPPRRNRYSTPNGGDLQSDIDRWMQGQQFLTNTTGTEPTQCRIVLNLPEKLSHVALTEADLLRLVGRKTVVDRTQQQIFDTLVAAASTSLWFVKISGSGLRLAHFLAQCCAETLAFTLLEERFAYTDQARLTKIFGNYLTAEQEKRFVARDEKTRHKDAKAAFIKAKQDAITKATPKPKTPAEQAALDKALAAAKTLTAEDLVALQKAYAEADKAEFAMRIELANTVYGGRNGNNQPGDGYRFRGRGLLHLTFRGNYKAAGSALSLPLESKPDMVAEPDTALRTAVWYWEQNKLNEEADGDNVLRVSKGVNCGSPNSTSEPNALEDRKKLTKLAKEIWGDRQPE